MTDKLVLVPAEATPEMLHAFEVGAANFYANHKVHQPADLDAARAAGYRAAIAAAPSPSIPEYQGLVDRLDRLAKDFAPQPDWQPVQGSRVASASRDAIQAITHLATQLEQPSKLNSKYAWERDKAREERDAAEQSLSEAREALRRIAEGNLGDDPWQANYDKIRAVAASALKSKPCADT